MLRVRYPPWHLIYRNCAKNIPFLFYSGGMPCTETQGKGPKIVDDTKQGMTGRIMGDKNEISKLS